jgi:hypothetical protein
MLKKLHTIFFCLSLTLLLSACGGGGGGTPVTTPTKVIVKLATSGVLPSGINIGGISTTINYPASKVGISDSNIVASGKASGATLLANTANSGSVVLGNVTIDSGFIIGEFATLTFTISGSSPQASDFTIASGSTSIGGSDYPPTDLTGQLSVIIESVTLQ